MPQTLKIWIRRVLMIVCPVILVVLEWHHPSGFAAHVYDGLIQMAVHWKNMHIYQSVLFGAVAVGAFCLTMGIDGYWSYLSKLCIWLFAICYIVFDSTAGVTVGSVLQLSLEKPELDTDTIKALVQHLYNDPIIGGTGSLFSLTGSWAWLIGIVSAGIAIFLNNRSVPLWKLWPPLLLLALSAYSLYVGHYSPYGPIAFAAFAAASLWFEIFRFGPAAEGSQKPEVRSQK